MDVIVVVILGVITLVAIIVAIRAKGETGKLTADNGDAEGKPGTGSGASEVG